MSTCGAPDSWHLPGLVAADARIFPRGKVERAADAVIAAATVPSPTRRTATRRLAEEEFSIEKCIERYAALLPCLKRAPVVGGGKIPSWTVADVASLSIAAARRARRWVKTRRAATTYSQ